MIIGSGGPASDGRSAEKTAGDDNTKSRDDVTDHQEDPVPECEGVEEWIREHVRNEFADAGESEPRDRESCWEKNLFLEVQDNRATEKNGIESEERAWHRVLDVGHREGEDVLVLLRDQICWIRQPQNPEENRHRPAQTDRRRENALTGLHRDSGRVPNAKERDGAAEDLCVNAPVCQEDDQKNERSSHLKEHPPIRVHRTRDTGDEESGPHNRLCGRRRRQRRR